VLSPNVPSDKHSLEHYLHLNYPIELVRDDENSWVASVPDLPGCNSYGDSVVDAVQNATKMKDLWIRSQYDSKQSIPEPIEEDDYSGKFVLRIPKTLHRSLAYHAQKQGVSLNHYASHLLSERNSVSQFQDIARSLFEFCTHQVDINSRHWGSAPMVLAANIPGKLEFLGYMRKPPNECTFRVEKKKLLNSFHETGK
jgi:antitoxin HicB